MYVVVSITVAKMIKKVLQSTTNQNKRSSHGYLTLAIYSPGK